MVFVNRYIMNIVCFTIIVPRTITAARYLLLGTFFLKGECLKESAPYVIIKMMNINDERRELYKEIGNKEYSAFSQGAAYWFV